MRYVALLRGINVGGKNMIKMELLKSLFVQEGFTDVVTYIQSGNIVFSAPKPVGDEFLEKRIESMIKLGVGFDVRCVVRGVEEVKQVIAGNPFPDAIADEHVSLYVYFLSIEPQDGISPLQQVLGVGEDIKLSGKHLYFVTPAFGNSKLTNAVVDKKLKLLSTARNWATVNKVAAL